MKILSIILGSALGFGNFFPGKCPDLPNQPDFDTERYLGIWHTYMGWVQNNPEPSSYQRK